MVDRLEVIVLSRPWPSWQLLVVRSLRTLRIWPQMRPEDTPQRIGAKRAGLVASAAFLTAVALSFEPFLIGRFGVAYLAVVLVADGIFIYCSTVHFRNPTQGQSWAKKGMLVALIAFLMGGLL